jgi:6-pyruvoyltetrahydropterin/6-carboxytetrahydropterin synthase
MYYEITHVFRFEAAHALSHLDVGHPCHRSHGHSYHVAIVLRADAVEPRTGFVVDPDSFARTVGAWITATFDRRDLNDVLGGGAFTTPERLAAFIAAFVRSAYPQTYAVTVHAADRAATYCPDPTFTRDELRAAFAAGQRSADAVQAELDVDDGAGTAHAHGTAGLGALAGMEHASGLLNDALGLSLRMLDAPDAADAPPQPVDTLPSVMARALGDRVRLATDGRTYTLRPLEDGDGGTVTAWVAGAPHNPPPCH